MGDHVSARPGVNAQIFTAQNLPIKIRQFLTEISVTLKLTFIDYPAIHTNYIISHCTTTI